MRRYLLAIATVASVLLPQSTWAQPVTVEYYHLDAVGSVRAVTNQSGQVVRRHDYFPFGDGSDGTTPGKDPHRFAGQERDPETGLDYFGARYYASRTGRFTTVDPVITLDENLVDPQRWNRYAYVRNNPLRYTDPEGRCIDGCVAEFALALVAMKATTDVAVYLQSPAGQQSVRDAVHGAGAMITTAVDGIRSWFQTEKRPGTHGKPDHQATAAEEAVRTGGKREVRIDTKGGFKDSRVADVAVVGVAGKIVGEIVQIYRPTPRGNIPLREKRAASDLERATGIKPTMMPVRPVPK